MSGDSLEGRRILVVGGAGFVGSNLVRAALAQNCASVHVVDNLLSSEVENLPNSDRLTLTVASITDEGLLASLDDVYDHVFHLATFHGNQNSIADPLADHENNTLTTLKLYESLKGFQGLKSLVYSSAGCTVAEKTFDTAEATTEDGPVSLDLDSPYQISKVIGEFYSVYYHRMHALPVVRARFQNVYGPGEVLGAGKWRGTPASIWRNVTPTFIYRALRHLPLFVNGDGSATRDFIYVDDIVRGLILCAASDVAVGDVFNLASGVEVTILELAQSINALAGNPAGIQLVKQRAWDRSGKRFGSAEKSKRVLGFTADTAIGDGLAATVEWTSRNLEYIERCIRQHAQHCPTEF